jgi:hypothetical protein
MPRVTIVEPIGEDRLGKVFDVADDGTLASGEPLFPRVCRARVACFDTLRAFAEYTQERSEESWCVLHSVPRAQGGEFVMIPEGARRSRGSEGEMLSGTGLEGLPVLTRTAGSLHFPPGLVTLPIDYDPPDESFLPSDHPWGAQKIWNALTSIAPGLEAAPRFHLPSSSAHITLDGRIVRGARGVRTVTLATLPHAAARSAHGAREYMKILHLRLILAGMCWPKVDRAGRLHLRTPIDLAAYIVTQPDFLGGPWLRSPRLGRDRPGVVYVPGKGQHGDAEVPFDLATVRPLDEGDRTRIARIEAAWRERLAGPMHERAQAWHAQMDEREHEACGARVDRATLRRRRMACMADAGAMLPLTHAIHVDDVGWRTGNDLVADPQAWHGKTCASPIDWLAGSRDGTSPGRHKGKILNEGGDVVVIDYASGMFTRYRFADDRRLEELVAAMEAAAAEPETAAAALAAAAANDLDAEPVDPPPVARRVMLPVVKEGEYQVVATRSRERPGTTVACSLDLQKAVVRSWFEHERFNAVVATYADAVRLRRWALSVRPDAAVMIMPGRSVDAAKRRAEHGGDVFAYPSQFPGEKEGLGDAICPKREAVAKLHSVGLATVARHACMLKVTKENAAAFGANPGDEFVCRHFASCGYNRRVAAKVLADVVIFVAASAYGPDNPLLEGEGEKPEKAMILDVADVNLSEELAWSVGTWERQAPLRRVLAMVRKGERPKRMPPGLARALDEWARFPSTRPDMPEEEALRAVETYSRSASCLVGKGEPMPLEAARAVAAWADGNAMIRETGDRVVAWRRKEMEKLRGTSTLIAASAGCKADITRSTLASLGAGVPAPPDADLAGLLEMPATALAPLGTRLDLVTGERRLPGRVVQVADDAIGAILGNGRDLEEDIARAPRKLRDVLHLAKILTHTIGPGILMTGAVPEIEKYTERMGFGATVVSFGGSNLVRWAADPPSREVRWAFVLGRLYPHDRQILGGAINLDPSDWAEALPASGKAFKARYKAAYRLKSGLWAPHPSTNGGAWRYAGSTERLDELFVSTVAAPVSYLAGALAALEADDGRQRTLGIFSAFPLASRQMVREGVLLDDVTAFDAVVPASGWTLQRWGGKESGRIGAGRDAENEARAGYWLRGFTATTLDELSGVVVGEP